MTLVLCWLQKSLGYTRLSAVADSRASREPKGSPRVTITEDTPKLFAVPVRCFTSDSLEFGTGAWLHPYFETSVGLGYTGNCFEALAVVAHIQRCFSQFVTGTATSPLPTGRGLVDLAFELLNRFIEGHADRTELTVRFVMFGWTPEGKPWIAKFGWKDGVRDELVYMVAKPSIFVAIGSDPGAAEAAAKLQRATANRFDRTEGARDFDTELEAQLHILAVGEMAERTVNTYLKDPGWKSIGGRLEKLELVPGKAVPCVARVALTHDRDAPFWQALPAVSQDQSLGYVPVVVNLDD